MNDESDARLHRRVVVRLLSGGARVQGVMMNIYEVTAIWCFGFLLGWMAGGKS